MRHDRELCEMILTCQLLVGNWSDLHANGLHLLNDVGESGAITRGDVQCFFCGSIFPARGERNERVDVLHISHVCSKRQQ